MGKNSISAVPSKIALFLKLENPEKYTGHSFRRTSATLLANTGVDVLALKRHGGWKSANIAESYVAESITNKNEVANKILYNKNVNSSSSSPSIPSSTITSMSSVSEKVNDTAERDFENSKQL